MTIRSAILGDLPFQLKSGITNTFDYVDNDDYRFRLTMVSSGLARVNTMLYVLEPKFPAGPKPVVVLLHGSGTLPTQGFGLRLEDEGGSVTRPDSTPFIGIAQSLAASGFTVLAPLLARTPALAIGQTPWMFTSVYGEILQEKLGKGSTATILVSQIRGAMDYATQHNLATSDEFYLVGWNEGAYLASLVGGIDSRVRAVVRLEAPYDRKRYRNSDGMQRDASFAHAECTLGDVAQATLLAGKPLMYAPAVDDANELLHSAFRSAAITDSIRAVYAKLGKPGSLEIAKGEPTPSVQGSVARWLRGQAGMSKDSRSPLPVPAVAAHLKFPLVEANERINETGAYLGRLRSCPAITDSVKEAPEDPGGIARMILASLHTQRPRGIARLLTRTLVDTAGGYRLSIIEYGRPNGARWRALLAEPPGDAVHPAVVSFNGTDDLADLFAKNFSPRVPYMSGYADVLAKRGFSVIVPIVPYWVASTFAPLTSARSVGRSSLWGTLLDQYEGAIDVIVRDPSVDSLRLAAYGISFGGVAAAITMGVDSRLKMLVYSNIPVDYEQQYNKSSGALLQTWLADACSVADASLLAIAPRPMIWEAGEDPLALNPNLDIVARVRERYRRLGVEERFTFTRHSGAHTTYPENIRIFGR